ncbi:MAG: hypothetical protein ABSG96_28515 [Terracidiphilus sp.]|jgi:hypothetical protein
MADHVISMDFNRLPAKQRFGTEQHSRVKTAVYEFPGVHAVEQAELSDGVGFFRAIRLTLLIEFGLGLAVFEVWRLLQ